MSTPTSSHWFSSSRLIRLVLFALLFGLALLPAAPLHTTVAAADASFASTPGPTGPHPLNRTSPPLQPAAVPPASFGEAGTLTLDSAENHLYSAVADVAGGYAYFGTYTRPGRIVKVRLSDFTKAATLTLNSDEGGLRTAILDAEHGFAYWATDTLPGKVIKVRLSDFTRVGALSFNSGEDRPQAAVIDSAGGYAYFASNGYPTQVIKVRLSDFTRIGALSLDAQDPTVSAAVLDPLNGSIYMGANDRLIKVRLSDFTRVGALVLNMNEHIGPGVIDPAGGYAYWGAHGLVVRVRLSDFSRVDALQTNVDVSGSAAFDAAGGYAYFGSACQPGGLHLPTPGRVAKVHLADFTLTGTLTLNDEESDLCSAVLDPEQGSAYFGTATVPGRIVKVRLSDLTRVGAVTLVAGDTFLSSALVDAAHGYAYFGTGFPSYSPRISAIGPARVVKVRLSDLSRVDTLELQIGDPSHSPEDSYVQAALIDPGGGYAYFATNRVYEAISTDSGSLVKVRLSDFTQVATISLDVGPIEVAAIDPENGFAYFGATSCGMTQICFSRIIKVRLSDLTKVGTSGLGLDFNHAHFTSAAIDPLHGYAYFGMLSDEQHGIAKIRLSDLAITSILQLRAQESTRGSAVVDPANGYAYFRLAGLGYSSVSKIRLSDFTRVDDLVFTSPQLTGAAAIDPAAGYAYFGASKIRLPDFTVAGMLPGWDPEHGPASAAIDADKGYLYWGMGADPSKVVRIDLGNTRTALVSSANPSGSGQSVRFTATISPVVSNSDTPAGTVQFKVDGANLGTPITLSNGSAMSPSVSNLSVGSHTITARYISPNADWNDSQATLTQTVQAITQMKFFYLPLVTK